MSEVPRPEPQEDAAAQRRDRVAGLLIVAVAFCAALSISWWGRVTSTPEVSEPPAPPTAEGLVGFPERVDPVQALSVARTLSRRTLFRGFVAENVRVDGTTDVSKNGRIRYAFQSAPGQGPQPPRAAGTLARQRYCGRQSVYVRQEGIAADEDRAAINCSPRDPAPLPEPSCGPREVWARALERGAPRDRGARIEYYRARGGPAWRFAMPGTRHTFSLDGDCQRVLEGEEAVGLVR